MATYEMIIEQDPPQPSEPSTSSAGQKRIAKMFNVSDAQILSDNIPTDYSRCTDEEPDSDPDNPEFTPDPLPSLANVDRLSLAAAAVDEGASSDEEESRIRPDVTHQWRKHPLDKQEREFQNMFQLFV
ncbi:hypothetical protein PoB_002718300 [Plakobranchus ocellatus]|uniref:PiggyBac transposable element-derived protein domain-containing protein n=1 Tax=Plakobranchus ocellatus TaxID=259542 RepID=A0AAV4A1U5_9GAST|nr:hypothetical protein PoB_002718300 [Plakobranchus ocellatus]